MADEEDLAGSGAMPVDMSMAMQPPPLPLDHLGSASMSQMHQYSLQQQQYANQQSQLAAFWQKQEQAIVAIESGALVEARRRAGTRPALLRGRGAARRGA